VCKGEMSPIHKDEKTHITVVFTTEQTEGRSIKHYLSNELIDLCNHCQQKVIEGHMIFGEGAMGNNRYWFKHWKPDPRTSEGQ
jgi:hypothetical protein